MDSLTTNSHNSISELNTSEVNFMDTKPNLQLVRRLFDEIYTKGNFNLFNEFFDNNVKLYDAAAPNFHGGLKELIERETIYKTAFPNKQLKIDEIFGADDKVVVRWTAQGTHRGELQGIPGTNKSFKISGISIYLFNNHVKISEIHQVWDRLGLLEQIGEIQPALALHR